MKTASSKRGLYRREIRTAENADDAIEIADNVSNSLEKYIEDAEQDARDELTKAGIEFVARPAGLVPQMVSVDRAKLSPTADQALDVLLYCRTACEELHSTATRNALWRGIMLAQSREHLITNLLLEKPANAGKRTIAGGRKGAKSKHGPTGSKSNEHQAAYVLRRSQYPSETKTESRKAVAKDLKKNYKTIERHTTDKALKGR